MSHNIDKGEMLPDYLKNKIPICCQSLSLLLKIFFYEKVLKIYFNLIQVYKLHIEILISDVLFFQI